MGAYEIVLENIRDELTSTDSILEIATGIVIITFAICRDIKRITSIDISLEMIKIATEKLSEHNNNNIDFQVGDACDLEYENRTFDKVICSNALHLLYTPDVAMQEMYRVLKDEGKIIVPTYCHGENIRTQILSRFLRLFGFRVQSRWSIKSFQEFILQNEFEIIKEKRIKDKIPLLFLVAQKKVRNEMGTGLNKSIK